MLKIKKKALSYDYEGHHYNNITTNMLGCFNDVLKIIYNLPVLIIVQIICLEVINILRRVEKKIEEFFSIDVLRPPRVLIKILIDAATLKSYLISLFYLGSDIFQSKILITTFVICDLIYYMMFI